MSEIEKKKRELEETKKKLEELRKKNEIEKLKRQNELEEKKKSKEEESIKKASIKPKKKESETSDISSDQLNELIEKVAKLEVDLQKQADMELRLQEMEKEKEALNEKLALLNDKMIKVDYTRKDGKKAMALISFDYLQSIINEIESLDIHNKEFLSVYSSIEKRSKSSPLILEKQSIFNFIQSLKVNPKYNQIRYKYLMNFILSKDNIEMQNVEDYLIEILKPYTRKPFQNEKLNDEHNKEIDPENKFIIDEVPKNLATAREYLVQAFKDSRYLAKTTLKKGTKTITYYKNNPRWTTQTTDFLYYLNNMLNYYLDFLIEILNNNSNKILDLRDTQQEPDYETLEALKRLIRQKLFLNL